MRLQYEQGDIVYLSRDYGGFTYEVRTVHKQGVTLLDRDTGETFYAGCRQIEPHPKTVTNATWIKEQV